MGRGTSGFTLLNSDLSGNPEGARGQLSFLLNYCRGHSGHLPRRYHPPPHPSSLFIQSKQADLQWLTQSTMFLVFFEDIET